MDLKQYEKYWKPLEKYMIMRPVLALISQGMIFRRLCGIILKIVAAFAGIGGLVLWIFGWKAIFTSGSAGIIIGGIIVEVLFVGLTYAIIHILLIRANDIENLPETGYSMIPIISVSLKLLGEIYASLLAFFGIAGAIFTWIAGASITQLFRTSMYMPVSIPEGFGFWGGLTSLLFGVIGSFGMLVFFYFLAELTVVLVDIATGLKNKK